MDNLFNTDSGFRPPSPLTFSSAPGPGLFGDSLGFEGTFLPKKKETKKKRRKHMDTCLSFLHLFSQSTHPKYYGFSPFFFWWFPLLSYCDFPFFAYKQNERKGNVRKICNICRRWC